MFRIIVEAEHCLRKGCLQDVTSFGGYMHGQLTRTAPQTGFGGQLSRTHLPFAAGNKQGMTKGAFV